MFLSELNTSLAAYCLHPRWIQRTTPCGATLCNFADHFHAQTATLQTKESLVSTFFLSSLTLYISQIIPPPDSWTPFCYLSFGK